MNIDHFKIIREISAIIAETPSYAEGLRRALECLARRLKLDACSILVYDEIRQRLVLEATHGLEQELAGNLELSLTESIAGYCFRTGEIVNVCDKQQHPEHTRFNSKRAEEYKGFLALPLIVGGRRIGVIDFEMHCADTFSEPLVDTLQAIASPLAVFVLNAKLAQEMGRTGEAEEQQHVLLTLEGRPVTNGVMRGNAHFLPGMERLHAVSPSYSADPEKEKELFQETLAIARSEIQEVHEEVSEFLAEADAAIFYAQLLLLEDPTLIQRINLALDLGCPLRFALKKVADQFNHEMERLDNAFMRDRMLDLNDVILRIFQAVDLAEGVPRNYKIKRKFRGQRKSIIVARELLPSQLIRIPIASIGGIVCEEGGATSHVAILAKALQIPMVVGVAGAARKIRPNDDLILDCNTGRVYVHPSPDVVKRFKPAISYFKKVREEKQPEEIEASAPATTTDGEAIRLAANVSLIGELPLLQRYGAMGIGLYRSEFMFMIRAKFPSEEEQYQVFSRIVAGATGGSVTIRVLDVGGDKPLPYVDFGKEDNPALGWRGVRFLLSKPEEFTTHLQAIIRASTHGHVNIMLPMIADLDELMQIKELLHEAERNLKRKHKNIKIQYRLGIMLEVPSVFWDLERIMPHIDFVSIGTNDLIQYAFAVDRGNNHVTSWFRQFHPIVLRMIRQTVEVVNKFPGKGVSVCGETAGTPRGVPLLIGLGLRYLSMNPWKIPQVRSAIEKCSLQECKELAERAISSEKDEDIVRLLTDFAERHDLRQEK